MRDKGKEIIGGGIGAVKRGIGTVKRGIRTGIIVTVLGGGVGVANAQEAPLTEEQAHAAIIHICKNITDDFNKRFDGIGTGYTFHPRYFILEDTKKKVQELAVECVPIKGKLPFLRSEESTASLIIDAAADIMIPTNQRFILNVLRCDRPERLYLENGMTKCENPQLTPVEQERQAREAREKQQKK